MRGRLLVGAIMTAGLMVGGQASASTSAPGGLAAVNTTFAGVATSKFVCPVFTPSCSGGVSSTNETDSYTFSGVTAGPLSPLASFTITLKSVQGNFSDDFASFVLDDHVGNTLTGGADDFGNLGLTLTGTVTAATGLYRPDLGRPVTITLEFDAANQPGVSLPVDSCATADCSVQRGVWATAGTVTVG